MGRDADATKSKKRRKTGDDERAAHEKKKRQRTEKEHPNGTVDKLQEEVKQGVSTSEKEQRRREKEEKRRRKEEKRKSKETGAAESNGFHKHTLVTKSYDESVGKRKHKHIEDEDEWHENGETNGHLERPFDTSGVYRMEIDDQIETDLPLQAPDDGPSGLHLITTKMYLPVPSVAVSYPLDGAVANSLTPLLLKYHPPFKGFILTFQKPRPTRIEDGEVIAKVYDEYSSSYLWVTVDFIIFRPNHGIYLKGEVTVHSASHLSLVVWNFFSASVERKRLPRGWKWVEEEMTEEKLKQLEREADEEALPKWKRKRFIQQGLGSWYDANGDRVEGEILFRALDFDVSLDKDGGTSMVSIEGSLVTEERDREIDAVV